MSQYQFRKEDIIILDDQQLQRYQAELLKIGKDVAQAFEDYGIEYSLSGGSILGAIRHQGFIPWDDDIDLNIPRASYDKLLEVFDQALGDKYYLQTPTMHPELGLLVTQIRKKHTVARRKYDWNSEDCGISIDLYIIENTFNNPVLRFIQKYMSLALSFALSSIREMQMQELPKEIFELEGRPLNYSGLKLAVGRFFKLIPNRYWIKWATKVNAWCRNDKSKYVAIPTGRKHFTGEIYLRENMCVFKDQAFEDTSFKVPIWAEAYLRLFYGENYLELPPVNQREKHLFLELKYHD